MVKQTVRPPVITADEGVSLYLQRQGLEMTAALEKAKKVFCESMPDVTSGMHNLYCHCNGQISMAQLYHTASRRALMNIKIDLVSYDSIVSLVQEIKGFGLGSDELNTLQHVALENRILGKRSCRDREGSI